MKEKNVSASEEIKAFLAQRKRVKKRFQKLLEVPLRWVNGKLVNPDGNVVSEAGAFPKKAGQSAPWRGGEFRPAKRKRSFQPPPQQSSSARFRASGWGW